ncbi:MAG: UDP-N-acetylglucosamine 4,6-dehydratase (inverting) [Candidatus Methanomarinus sp.]|uniref:UDP-N-acetylglucosamine 4,6-dehydratase (Inverting) n=1 Tax=Candidatus Methanomarinus sp. TaxID=3386244 RepID=A0AC61SC15_9EURY|nr:MAG: UDP-N-acetylglucosamine 4,6-dehydratase [ANME-2 cluster archaeon]TKY92132.1 MAG: UDP-N-acetylglucosamine 4,6-dehydratase (inverting) [ANME-2 cluster archaeon]
MSIFDDKIILITGGTGSFGNKFTEILLSEHDPESVRIYSRGELLQMEMQNRFDDPRLRFLIGDVRDRDRLYRAAGGVDIIVHAAALKHVPACEYNPIEAVRTNVDGSVNVIDAAIDNSVDKIMAISTDKAVHPVNLYGATKMVAEKLFTQGNAYTGGKKTILSCVRYGNVIGSRGSVIPLFKKQQKNGVITITDDRMTRFWITLEQGVRFVMDCIARMKGGEIFVPKIPSMGVIDLAKVIAPDAERKVVGIRSGEKLHEILLTEDEARHTREFSNFFIIEPEHPFWDENNFNDEKSLPEGFRYTSDGNERWLTEDEIGKIVDES